MVRSLDELDPTASRVPKRQQTGSGYSGQSDDGELVAGKSGLTFPGAYRNAQSAGLVTSESEPARSSAP